MRGMHSCFHFRESHSGSSRPSSYALLPSRQLVYPGVFIKCVRHAEIQESKQIPIIVLAKIVPSHFDIYYIKLQPREGTQLRYKAQTEVDKRPTVSCPAFVVYQPRVGFQTKG